MYFIVLWEIILLNKYSNCNRNKEDEIYIILYILIIKKFTILFIYAALYLHI